MRFSSRAEIRVPFEVKFLAEGTGEFHGYGAVFNVLDYVRDIILPGAFAETLAEHGEAGTVPGMYWWHDPKKPCGTWSLLREDDRGLYVEGKLNLEDPNGLKAYATMKEEGGADLSIGYRSLRYETDRVKDIRTLKAVWLDEVSLAPRGMGVNPEAGVVGYKAADRIQTIRDFESFLREVGGFSRAKAKAIAERGFKAWPNPPGADGEADTLAAVARLTSIITS